MQHDFYRQYSYHRLSGSLDAQNNIVAWSHRVVSTPIRAVFDSPETLKDPKHVASQELGGADVIPYAVSNFRLDYSPVHSAVPQPGGGRWQVRSMVSPESVLWMSWHTPPAAIRMSLV
jgi:isoquinoline 1-oxidoreductase subunit beta